MIMDPLLTDQRNGINEGKEEGREIWMEITRFACLLVMILIVY